MSRVLKFLPDIRSVLSRSRIYSKLITGHFQHTRSHSGRPQVIHAHKKLKNLPSVIAEKFSIRQSRPEDISALEQLACKEGWMCLKSSFNAILRLDPDSLIVAADEFGTPVGYLGICHVLEDTAYLIHFVVRKDLRGKGIGRHLHTAMIERLEDNNGYMDVVMEDIKFQEKKGYIHRSFKFYTFKGIVNSTCRNPTCKETQCNIVPVKSEELWHKVLEYDRNVYNGLDRERMLRAFLSGEDNYIVAAVHDGKVKGYGSLLVSTGHEGVNSINTIFGDDQDTVNDIVRNLLENISCGSTLTFNLMAGKRLCDIFLGFELCFVQQRLYNKYSLEDGALIDRMYFIHSF